MLEMGEQLSNGVEPMTPAIDETKLALIAERIKASTSLSCLHAALVEFEAAGKAEHGRYFNSESELRDCGVEICDLPTFGGEEPASTCEIWSWDEDCVLVAGVGSSWDWEIQDRE